MAEKEYIEREAAKKKHCEICLKECICYRSKSTCDELKAFDLIPAADVRPVVRGKWKETGGNHLYSLCPVCREPYAKLDVLGTEQNKNFCPNCGADMRGEQT